MVNNVEKQEDVEYGDLSPDHGECNGSRSSKQCKHREKREMMEKEREREEQLKVQEEIQQEEIQPVHDGKDVSYIYLYTPMNKSLLCCQLSLWFIVRMGIFLQGIRSLNRSRRVC